MRRRSSWVEARGGCLQDTPCLCMQVIGDASFLAKERKHEKCLGMVRQRVVVSISKLGQ
jgi:hypothetical protein